MIFDAVIRHYHLQEKYPQCDIDELTIELDDKDKDFVKLNYKLINKPETNRGFNRIRRISGYLVGDLGRWNNAKRQEEHDRVKHGITDELGKKYST